MAAQAVRQSVFAGMAVADRLHSAPLLESIRAAFVHGIEVALLVSAGIAGTGIVLSLAFLPATFAPRAARHARAAKICITRSTIRPSPFAATR